jgi:hypothetical protein
VRGRNDAPLLIALSLLARRITVPSRAGHFRYSAALACGVDRWKAKTCHRRSSGRASLPGSNVVWFREQSMSTAADTECEEQGRVFCIASNEASS